MPMRLISIAIIFLTTVPAFGDGVPRGCFHRVYSEQHLIDHPAQIVKELKLSVYDARAYDEIWADMVAVLADQGRIKGNRNVGKPLDQVFNCSSKGEKHQCVVDCDGGSFRFTRVTSDSITIETSYLTIGPAEECGGSVNMVEILDTPVRYRLNRVDAAQCATSQ